MDIPSNLGQVHNNHRHTHTHTVSVCVSVLPTAAPCTPTNQPSTTNLHPLPKMMRPQKKESGQDDTNDLADRLDCWATGGKRKIWKKSSCFLGSLGYEWYMQLMATHSHLFPGFCATCWQLQSIRREGWPIRAGVSIKKGGIHHPYMDIW